MVASCTPKINVNLGFGGGDLKESTVLSSEDAPDKVALIDVRGLLADIATPGLIGSGPNPVDLFVSRLDLAEKDPAVKAVIVRINSPGGTVTASDIMYGELRRFRDKTGKPVVVCMGEIAASGGYYLALAGDEIIAQPTTITGSIGVIIPTINFSDGMSRIGIRARNVTSGTNKDLASPFSPIRDEQYAVLQTMVDEYYARFRGLVVSRRPGLKAADLDAATDGRVVSGERALAMGLVDRTGTVRDALDRAKALAGLERARLVKYGAESGYGPPRSPYANVDAPAAAGPAAGDREINLVQLRLGASALGESPAAWYVWTLGW